MSAVVRLRPCRLIHDHQNAAGERVVRTKRTGGIKEAAEYSSTATEEVVVRRAPGVNLDVLDIITARIILTCGGDHEDVLAASEVSRRVVMQFVVPHLHGGSGCVRVVSRADLDRIPDDDVPGDVFRTAQVDRIRRVCVRLDDIAGRIKDELGDECQRREDGADCGAYDEAAHHGQTHSPSRPMAAFTHIDAATCSIQAASERRSATVVDAAQVGTAVEFHRSVASALVQEQPSTGVARVV